MMPQTGRCFTIQQDGLHNCEMMGHRVEDFLPQNHPFLIIVFYGFPNNMVCSHEVSNDISLHYSPVDHIGTQKKYNKELDYKTGYK